MAGPGRLELTWSGKDRRLLAHGEDSYEWVDATDWRVSEVRLLHETGTVGDETDNLLIQGDALYALTALARIPELAANYAGQVQLCYIDPPFNTGQTFAHYDDALEHSVWLTMLRDRLVQIRRLLAPNGSVWVHLDDAEAHRGRSVLDEVFGAENFVATVIWEKVTSARNDALLFSTDQDYIHVYARDAALFRPNRDPYTTASERAYRNPDNDPRGPWREVDYKGPKSADERPNLYYPLVHPVTGQEVWPPRNRVWAYGPEAHQEHLEANLLWWGKSGNYRFPKLKKFLSERTGSGTPPRTLWRGDEVDTSRRAKAEIKALFPDLAPFATPKPERLLRRILHLGSRPGDLVLDCFVGSGTTSAVAHKMGRRWIGVELLSDVMNNYARPRLEKVVKGDDPGGVSKDIAWEGGGGFTTAEVAPSMFEDLEGTIVLAEWATGGSLAEAVAAQLGYAFETDPPFAGRKGRSRLAVLDGMLTEGLADYLLARLDNTESLNVVAQSLEPGIQEYLSRRRSGSRARKVPRDLAHVGRPSRLVRLSAQGSEAQYQELES